MPDSDWYYARIECAERGVRALCALHGLIYPHEIDYDYTRPEQHDTEFIHNAEDFTPFRTEDFDLHSEEIAAQQALVDDWLTARFGPPLHIAAPPTWYERQDWIAHYDAMQLCFQNIRDHLPTQYTANDLALTHPLWV
jgi:hypothetical protein